MDHENMLRKFITPRDTGECTRLGNAHVVAIDGEGMMEVQTAQERCEFILATFYADPHQLMAGDVSHTGCWGM
jgi:hypothetical protein